jgi:DNA primase
MLVILVSSFPGKNTQAMAIPQNFIQELVSRADIVEIVGRSVQLKKGGANFMGLCPFHSEKSPSFSVSPSKQFYHCFGCGKNGNAISFLIENNGMTFIEAVQDLAQQFGMQIPEDDATPQDRERAAQQRARQATLTDVLEKAGEAYRKHLKNSPKAVAYFKGRGVSGEIAREFGLGYAPEGWRSLASVFPDYDEPLLAESGLVIVHEDPSTTSTTSTGSGQASAGQTISKRYDRFRDRVMFPIRNVKGECIGFGGRVLGDEKPKYLNSPETPVFSKGRELYGLYEARQALREHGFVLVTEGYMDVVALAQLGFANTVATLGTACTADHVQKLFRFTDSVVFSFDGDAAGRRAARKALDGALPYATDVRSVKFLFLPPEHDPDSFIREFGADAFSRYISEATPLSRFLVDAARDGCDLGSAEGRAHLAANARPLWGALPDGALKRQLLAEIATLVQLDAVELSQLWGHAAPAAARSRPRRTETAPRPARPGRTLPPGRADRALQIVLAEPSAWESLSQDDHQLLCELAAPHGPLFSWLDCQVHDHGPQPWVTLRAALQGHEHEAFAVGQVGKVFPDIENDLQELRQILTLERKRRDDEATTELVSRAKTDPAAYEQLRQRLDDQKSRSRT